MMKHVILRFKVFRLLYSVFQVDDPAARRD